MKPNTGIFAILICLVLAGCNATPRQVQLLDAPQRQAPQAIPTSGFIIVEEGDTIYSIANKYKIFPERIITQNGLRAPFFTLEAGQQLKLTPSRVHAVRRGDSLYNISQRYAVSQFQLAQLNGIEPPYELRVGQQLQLPFSYDLSALDAAETPIKRPAKPSSTGTPVAANTPVVQPKKPTKRKNFIAPTLSSADGFNWPVSGEVLQEFGPAERGVHNDGLNIAAKAGTLIQTAAPGTVAYIGEGLKSFGTLVLVKHDGGYVTAYAHLEGVSVSEGDVLSKGQVVGRVGATGGVTTPQLHFEIRLNRAPINPRELISG